MQRVRIRANWRIEHDGVALEPGGEAAVEAALAERLAAGGSAEILGLFEPDILTELEGASGNARTPAGAPVAPAPGNGGDLPPAAVVTASPDAVAAKPDAEAAGASASTATPAADGGRAKSKSTRAG